MALKFCANLGFMFTEAGATLAERYALATSAGFKGVEGPCPDLDDDLAQIIDLQAKTGFEQVLLNYCTANIVGGEFGCASIPHLQNEFRTNLLRTIECAKKLHCKKIHIMAGKMSTSEPTDANHTVYIQNLKYAAQQLRAADILGVIEPINKYSVPGYYLNSFERAADVINEVNSPHLRLMLDLFHLQHIKGNIANTIAELMAQNIVGHVQLAQVPGRNEPNSEGELNFEFILRHLSAHGYSDWVGCEYKAKTTSVEGLRWLRELGYSL